MKSVNPYTGATSFEVTGHTPEEVGTIIGSVAAAFRMWKNSPYGERAGRLTALAALLRERKEELALLIVSEMGKVKREAMAEVEKCATVCDYYAMNGEAFLQPEPIATEAPESYVSWQPIGVVLAVMPWNFPFWQVFRFLAPALMAGNGGVLKHASNVSGCALAIEKLVSDAGFPLNIFRTLLIGSSQVGEVINHPLISAVTLTGSTPAGQAVASAAGHALKKSVMELGGSDPYIILEDADIKEAARLCTAGRLLNAGQSCIGAKRFIIIESVYDAFREAMVRQMSEAVYGDPLDPATTIGPLARPDLRDELHKQVTDSVALGALIVTGGFLPGHPALYPPTVLENVTPGMPAWHEELFGPVAVLFKAKDEAEALHIANDTVFGLGAGVFTADRERGRRLAERGLEAGAVFVNDFVKSDPRLPFGGIKTSGYGRELSVIGIREFMNCKTIVIR